jgi:hypothetical protein
MRSAVAWPKPLSCGHGPADPGFRLALPMDLLHSRVTIISDRAILFALYRGADGCCGAAGSSQPRLSSCNAT